MYFFVGKRNDDEGAKEKLFTYVSHVPVTSFKVRRYTPQRFASLTRL